MSSALLAFAVPVLMQPLVQSASGQGEISGRVVSADSGRLPIQGAEAALVKLGRIATSDSSGRFRFRDVPPGDHLLVVRAIGFKSESSSVFIDRDEVVSSQLVMTRSTATTLPERVVTAPPEVRPSTKLLEFNERRGKGIGGFITREQLAKAEGGVRQTGDLISMLPGVVVRRGSNKIWIASGRALPGTKTPVFNAADFAAGARAACFVDVYIDGAMVFDSKFPEYGLFDVNTVPPEHIAGIEVYTSTSQIPAKYDRPDHRCGVLLIWTR